MNFNVLGRAGLTQEDFASYLDVSRVSVNNWIRGASDVHEARKPRVKKLLAAVSAAVADGKLPLTDTPKARRRTEARKVILSYLRQ